MEAKEISSRKRVAVACNRCRAGKYKCDGAKPMCSTCSAARRPVTCTYEISSKKRGLREGYVRGMETLWGIAMRKMDGLEELLLSVLGDHQDPLLQAWNDNSNSAPLRVWRKSRLSHALDRQLHILEKSRDSLGKRKRYVTFSDTEEDGDEEGEERKEAEREGGEGGPVSPVEDIIMDPASLFRPEEDHDINPQLSSSSLQPTGETPKQIFPVSSEDCHCLPSSLGCLVDVYFSYTHCWFPILEKYQIRRLVYQHFRNNNRDSDANSARGPESDISTVILWAIAALSTHQVSQSELWYINCGHPSNPRDLVWIYYKKTRSMIPPEEDEANFKVVHVQALLIIAILEIGHGNWSTSWLLVGRAIHIAINLGLDNPCRTAQTKDDPRSLHVFWGCFVLDTLISAKISRMPHLRREDIDGIDLLCEEGDEEWDSWLDYLQVYTAEKIGPGLPLFILSTFNRLIEACKILNICCVSRHRRGLSFPLGLHLIHSLTKWNDEQRLPFKLDVKSMDFTPTTYLHHYHLQLVYLLSLDIIKESVQENHTEEQWSARTNAPVGVLLGNVGFLTSNLLKQQSEQHSVLVVPATYALIFHKIFQYPELRVTNDTKNCFSDLVKIWPGVGRASNYQHPQASEMYQMHNNPPPHNLDVYSMVPPGLLDEDPSDIGSYRVIQQISQLGSNEGALANDNTASLSEIDLHSTFDELVSMDANYWTGNWRQGLVNLGFAEDDHTSDLYNFP